MSKTTILILHYRHDKMQGSASPSLLLLPWWHSLASNQEHHTQHEAHTKQAWNSQGKILKIWKKRWTWFKKQILIISELAASLQRYGTRNGQGGFLLGASELQHKREIRLHTLPKSCLLNLTRSLIQSVASQILLLGKLVIEYGIKINLAWKDFQISISYLYRWYVWYACEFPATGLPG